jgi:hypothetical protein
VSVLLRARLACKPVDLVMMALIESLRSEGQPAHATAIASHIGGAPIIEVNKRLTELAEQVGVVDKVVYRDNITGREPQAYALNSLGAEVLVIEVPGWEPNPLEQARRDRVDPSAQAGRMRS